MYREIGPNALAAREALKGSFSTWQGHPEAEQETKNEVKNLPFKQRPCLCGMKYHGPAKCYYLNAKIRPSAWRKEKRKVEKIEKEFAADPAQEKQAREAVEKANSKNSTSNSSNSSNATLIRLGNMAFSSQAIGPAAASLKKRWILDSGSNVHVCNEKSRFIDLQPCHEVLATGEGDTAVIGRGTVRLTGADPITKQERVITLSDACYAPGFYVNLVSYAKLKDKGGKWNESGGYIQDHDAIPIVSLQLWRNVGLQVFDELGEAISNTANAVRSSTKPLNETATAELWHRRLGHPQLKTVQQVAKLVDGVTISDNHEAQAICETCQTGRANRQVSRRPRGRVFGRFGRVYFDLIQLPNAYNRHRQISHFYIEGVRFHWVITYKFKPECQLAIYQFVDLARNWWNLPIKAFNYDNETSVGRAAEYGLTKDGIVVYHSPLGHLEMNGHAERAGGAIILRIRMLMLEGKLPKELQPEAAMAAVWLLNRTPTYLADEKRQIVLQSDVTKQFTAAGDAVLRINLSNVRLYRSLAYCRIEKQVQSDKMNPRAEVGFLVGYVASNIWRIWFPQTGKVKLVRDAVFDKKRRYSPDFRPLQ